MAIIRKGTRCNVCLEEHSTTSVNNKGLNHVNDDRMIKLKEDGGNSITFNDRKTPAFIDFCKRTSLHGWNNLANTSLQKDDARKSAKRFGWVFIICFSIAMASFFLFTSIDDFTSKNVVTTIDTTTVSLHHVHFPSIIVCNINQIRKSSLLGLGVKNDNDIDLLYRQFYSGMDRNLTMEEMRKIIILATSDGMLTKLRSFRAMVEESNSTYILELMKNFNKTEFLKKHWRNIIKLDFIRDIVVEDPGDSPILSARYGHHQMRENATDFLPFYGTDKGACSIIKPQIFFDSKYDHLTYAQKLFGSDGVSYTRKIEAGAKVGKANGLKLVLDAETFDYTMNTHVSEGFKISVNHHLDQPLMSMTELDISPGLETQLAVTPVLYGTSKVARTRFTPKERGCYFDNELNLTYLPKKWYRYSISNCLFEAAYEKILKECKCTPFFHTLALAKVPRICKGQSLLCMNVIIDQIGEYREVAVKDAKSGGIRVVECLEACEDQQNEVTVTASRIPNRQTMLKWPEFCTVVEKLKMSCSNQWKRVELDKNYPSLCFLLLSEFYKTSPNPAVEDNKKVCIDILNNINMLEPLGYSQHKGLNNSSHDLLLKELFKYTRQNIAIANIYIRPPVVTRILKDERIPLIRFVANTGGLLGLCMGCSLITGFEVLYYISGSLSTLLINKYKSYKQRPLQARNDKTKDNI